MKNQLIENEVKEEINQYIVESLTVNDEVLHISEEVEKYIIDDIKQIDPISFCNGGGKREFNFQLDLFDDKIKCNFVITNFNFKDKQYYQEYIKKYSIDLECKSIYKKKNRFTFCVCYINYISVGFKPLKKFYEDVYHELNHIYQQYKEEHTYSDSERYVNISNNIYSENDIERNCAIINYLSTYYEQDSYVSSVYNYIKNNVRDSFENSCQLDKLIKETDAYKKIVELKKIYNIILNNKESYKEELLNNYSYSNWNQFSKKIEKAISRFEKKFAMVVRKCKSDFLVNETNAWTELGNKNIYYKLY